MHSYCFKITNVSAVSFCQYLNPIRWLQMLSVNRHGIVIIRINVQSIISVLHIESLITNLHKNVIRPINMSGFHQIHLLWSYVRILYQISVSTLLQKCLKKLVVQFVENWLQFVRWKSFMKLRISACLKLMESQEKLDTKALIQKKSEETPLTP